MKSTCALGFRIRGESYFMGVVSLVYGVALIAGVIVLLPSLVKRLP